MLQRNNNKPINSALLQQRLPSIKPIFSPGATGCIFFLFFALFLAIGIVILTESLKIVEVEVEYTDACPMERDPTHGNLFCQGNVSIAIPQTMNRPVFMYYKLINFYQNHRLYSSEIPHVQLGGRFTTSPPSDCKSVSHYGESSEMNHTMIYNPCGLVAWSMFNDSFILKHQNEIICNSLDTDGTDCTKEGIAWWSDKTHRYQTPAGVTENRMHNQTYYKEATHKIPNVQDEDFIVWMRVAPLPTFRKLHRIIDRDLPAGTYQIEVNQNFPVSQFSGRKAIVLSTVSWIGGKNMPLAIAFLVVGCIFFFCSVLFFFGFFFKIIRSKM